MSEHGSIFNRERAACGIYVRTCKYSLGMRASCFDNLCALLEQQVKA